MESGCEDRFHEHCTDDRRPVKHEYASSMAPLLSEDRIRNDECVSKKYTG